MSRSIRRQKLERLGTENGLALVGAAVNQHLRIARVVRHGRDHAATGEHYLLGNRRVVVAPHPEIAVVRHRLGEQLLLFRVRYEKAGVLHAERIDL